MRGTSEAWQRACETFGYQRMTEAEFVGRVNSVTQTITMEKDRFNTHLYPKVMPLENEIFHWFWRIGEPDPDLIECRWVILTRVPLKGR